MPREVDAITKQYDLILWIIPKLEQFPRTHKLLIADRIESLLLDILENLIEAAYSRKKDVSLRAANLGLEKLRYLIRFSKDLKLLSLDAIVRSRKLPSCVIPVKTGIQKKGEPQWVSSQPCIY